MSLHLKRWMFGQVCAAAAALLAGPAVGVAVAVAAIPAPDVDIVIPASCPGDTSVSGGVPTMVQRERDNGELHYTLKAIQKNAKWVRKIFVLQNPGCRAWFANKTVPEPAKTKWVDRCSLYPQGFEQDCPTRNSFAVMTVLHRVPDLAELFVFVEDDDLVIAPSTVDTFFAFSEDKQEYLPQSPLCNLSTTYDSEPFLNAEFTSKDIPLSQVTYRQSHTWIPMKRAVGYQLEKDFPKFVSFVRSHFTGRYSSALNAFGTAESDKNNSQEENLQGVWWSVMCNQNMSVQVDNRNLFQDNRLGDWAAWDIMTSLQHRIIVNINDDFSLDPDVYKEQRADARTKLTDAGFALLLTRVWEHGRRERAARAARLRGAAAGGLQPGL